LNPREKGFLLLSSQLGNPDRRPLTTAQLRVLADRSWQLDCRDADRDLEEKDLLQLGYNPDMAGRILKLLSEEEALAYYLRQGEKAGCVPVTRVSQGYPLRMRRSLGLDSPGVLWAKGDLSLLEKRGIALVGSRDLNPRNREFAEEAGYQAAKQGFVLISGNARGADRTAQQACLRAGGRVISVVADSLAAQHDTPGVLYLSESCFDQAFSAQRALSRNRVIHSMAEKVLVAQCTLKKGGTWDGTVKNLRFGWSPVFCFRDGSESVELLARMGAGEVGKEALEDLRRLCKNDISLFDQ